MVVNNRDGDFFSLHFKRGVQKLMNEKKRMKRRKANEQPRKQAVSRLAVCILI